MVNKNEKRGTLENETSFINTSKYNIHYIFKFIFIISNLNILSRGQEEIQC